MHYIGAQQKKKKITFTFPFLKGQKGKEVIQKGANLKKEVTKKTGEQDGRTRWTQKCVPLFLFSFHPLLSFLSKLYIYLKS